MKKLATFLIILAISCATTTREPLDPNKPKKTNYNEFGITHAACENCDEID
jgi:hypothetical protein